MTKTTTRDLSHATAAMGLYLYMMLIGLLYLLCIFAKGDDTILLTISGRGNESSIHVARNDDDPIHKEGLLRRYRAATRLARSNKILNLASVWKQVKDVDHVDATLQKKTSKKKNAGCTNTADKYTSDNEESLRRFRVADRLRLVKDSKRHKVSAALQKKKNDPEELESEMQDYIDMAMKSWESSLGSFSIPTSSTTAPNLISDRGTSSVVMMVSQEEKGAAS